MKTRKIVGGTLAAFGLIAAVSVADGCEYESAARLFFVAVIAAGAYIARLFDFQK